jgi:hypothetical protein
MSKTSPARPIPALPTREPRPHGTTPAAGMAALLAALAARLRTT